MSSAPIVVVKRGDIYTDSGVMPDFMGSPEFRRAVSELKTLLREGKYEDASSFLKGDGSKYVPEICDRGVFEAFCEELLDEGLAGDNSKYELALDVFSFARMNGISSDALLILRNACLLQLGRKGEFLEFCIFVDERGKLMKELAELISVSTYCSPDRAGLYTRLQAALKVKLAEERSLEHGDADLSRI